MDAARDSRYWAKVDKRGPDECWPWLAFRNPWGYGMFAGGDEQLAHRYGYRVATGDAPGDLCVCHRCDNPCCQNPAHFFLGTPADNAADKVAKGRQSRHAMHGEANPRAKLTASDVDEIRRRYLDGETQEALAAEFGVAQSAVSKAMRGDRWKGGPVIDGAGRRASGMRNPKSKMTDAEVADARAAYAAGGVSQQALADRYGVSQASMSAIIRRVTRI